MPRLIARMALAIAVMLGTATAANAAPFYVASTDPIVPSSSSCLQQGGTSVTCSTDVTFDVVTVGGGREVGGTSARANAGPSSLALFISQDMTSAISGATRRRQTMAAAFMGFDDFIISGPDSSSSVVAAVNLDVHGFFDANASVLTGTPFARTEVLLSLGVLVVDPRNLRTNGDIAMVTDTRTTPETSFTSRGGFRLSGNLSPGTSDFPFVSRSFVMPVGEPFQVEIGIRGDVINTIAGSGQATSSGSLDLLNTVNFPALSPVFSLPDGFTLNSLQAQIEDNRWIGGQLTSVPEPGTLALFSLALFGLALRRRRAPPIHLVGAL